MQRESRASPTSCINGNIRFFVQSTLRVRHAKLAPRAVDVFWGHRKFTEVEDVMVQAEKCALSFDVDDLLQGCWSIEPVLGRPAIVTVWECLARNERMTLPEKHVRLVVQNASR